MAKKTTLRKMTKDDVRKMIIAGQGWDPGPLDPDRIKPLSKKELNRPFMRMLKKKGLT